MQRKKGLDFVRAMSALGIIAFHFYCHSNSHYQLFYTHANGSWGLSLNVVFFVLSGFLIHKKYASAKFNVRAFYFNRWKVMLPAYLLVSGYVYLTKVLSWGSWFYLGVPKSRLILSLIGMDGYFASVMLTYVNAGEWFLGGILIAYAMYPLLRQAVSRAPGFILAVLVGGYLLTVQFGFFGFPLERTPVYCLLCFTIGMALSQRPKVLEQKCWGILGLGVGLVMLLVPFGGEIATKEIIIGTALFLGMNWIGEYVCKIPLVYRAVSFVGSMSYYTFLIHHNIIYKTLEGFNSGSTIRALGALAGIIVMSLVFSKVLDVVVKALFASPVFQKLERIALGKGTAERIQR